MKNTFLNLLRTPDDIKIQTESSPFRFEEKGEINNTAAEVKCVVNNGVLNIYLYPNGDAVKYVRLRFNGDISGVSSVLGDSLVRSGTDDIVWHSFLPHQAIAGVPSRLRPDAHRLLIIESRIPEECRICCGGSASSSQASRGRHKSS